MRKGAISRTTSNRRNDAIAMGNDGICRYRGHDRLGRRPTETLSSCWKVPSDPAEIFDPFSKMGTRQGNILEKDLRPTRQL